MEDPLSELPETGAVNLLVRLEVGGRSVDTESDAPLELPFTVSFACAITKSLRSFQVSRVLDPRQPFAAGLSTVIRCKRP